MIENLKKKFNFKIVNLIFKVMLITVEINLAYFLIG
jgi:hypothetical protein